VSAAVPGVLAESTYSDRAVFPVVCPAGDELREEPACSGKGGQGRPGSLICRDSMQQERSGGRDVERDALVSAHLEKLSN
jgi:hypothetical protein